MKFYLFFCVVQSLFINIWGSSYYYIPEVQSYQSNYGVPNSQTYFYTTYNSVPETNPTYTYAFIKYPQTRPQTIKPTYYQFSPTQTYYYEYNTDKYTGNSNEQPEILTKFGPLTVVKEKPTTQITTQTDKITNINTLENLKPLLYADNLVQYVNKPSLNLMQQPELNTQTNFKELIDSPPVIGERTDDREDDPTISINPRISV